MRWDPMVCKSNQIRKRMLSCSKKEVCLNLRFRFLSIMYIYLSEPAIKQH